MEMKSEVQQPAFGSTEAKPEAYRSSSSPKALKLFPPPPHSFIHSFLRCNLEICGKKSLAHTHLSESQRGEKKSDEWVNGAEVSTHWKFRWKRLKRGQLKKVAILGAILGQKGKESFARREMKKCFNWLPRGGGVVDCFHVRLELLLFIGMKAIVLSIFHARKNNFQKKTSCSVYLALNISIEFRKYFINLFYRLPLQKLNSVQ